MLYAVRNDESNTGTTTPTATSTGWTTITAHGSTPIGPTTIGTKTATEEDDNV